MYKVVMRLMQEIITSGSENKGTKTRGCCDLIFFKVVMMADWRAHCSSYCLRHY